MPPPPRSPEPSGPRALAEIRAAGTAAGRARLGCCSLEGTRLFERALRARARIPLAVTTAAVRSDETPRVRALLEALEASGCVLHVLPDEDLHSLTQGRGTGDLVGLAELPSARSLADLQGEPHRGPPFYLGCVGVDDPGNLGALARTAHASGAQALLAVRCCDAFHPRAVRTSMGSLFRLPVLTWSTLATALTDLRAVGVRSAGAVSSDGVALDGFAFGDHPWAVFLGSEAFGLSADDRGALDATVSIPMPPGVDSFSVNAAAAVLLWELRRGDG